MRRSTLLHHALGHDRTAPHIWQDRVGSPTHRAPNPKAPIWIVTSRFQSICSSATAFGWEEPGEQLATRSTREVRGRQLLATGRGSITPATMMEILRDHDGGICMHGAIRTTASLVCRVGRGVAPRIWMTWGDNPCEGDFREMAPPLPAGSEDRIMRYGCSQHPSAGAVLTEEG